MKDMLSALRHLAEYESHSALPGYADADIETTQAIVEECAKLREAYQKHRQKLAAGTTLDFLSTLWRRSVVGADPKIRLQIQESATLLQLQQPA